MLAIPGQKLDTRSVIRVYTKGPANVKSPNVPAPTSCSRRILLWGIWHLCGTRAGGHSLPVNAVRSFQEIRPRMESARGPASVGGQLGARS